MINDERLRLTSAAPLLKHGCASAAVRRLRERHQCGNISPMSENSSQQLLLTIALALAVLGAAPRAWSMSQESGGMASPVAKSGALAQMSGPGASGREIGGHDMSHDMSGMDMTHMGHDMAHMHMGAPPDPAKLAADKAFSEFNHRFAGVFVLLVGALALFEPRLARRAAWVRYLWSVLFFFPGLYLFFYSDPESWPVGSQSLQYVIHSNPEVLQHKVFSLLLLGLGVVEFIRVRRNLRSLALSAVFPVLAVATVECSSNCRSSAGPGLLKNCLKKQFGRWAGQ